MDGEGESHDTDTAPHRRREDASSADEGGADGAGGAGVGQDEEAHHHHHQHQQKTSTTSMTSGKPPKMMAKQVSVKPQQEEQPAATAAAARADDDGIVSTSEVNGNDGEGPRGGGRGRGGGGNDGPSARLRRATVSAVKSSRDLALEIPSKLQLLVGRHMPQLRAHAALTKGVSTVVEKMAVIENTADTKTLKQTWINLILSKEFTGIIDQVFDRCCLLNDTDDFTDANTTLDRTELQFAMKLLWEKLDMITGGQGKLPRIKESEEEVLRTYDDNNDGHLSRQEFHGFARTYFSRMEWPLWRAAMKGAAKGAAFFIVNRIFIIPIFDKMKDVVVPRIIYTVKRKVGEKWKRKFVDVKRKLKLKFRSANPFFTDFENLPKVIRETLDDESMPEEMMREIRLEKIAAWVKFVKNILITSAIGATASMAGLL